jgi:hypothetical protein
MIIDLARQAIMQPTTIDAVLQPVAAHALHALTRSDAATSGLYQLIVY